MHYIGFTAAPIAYDWSGVVSSTKVPFVNHKGEQFRMVVIEEDRAVSQIGRYGSGLYPTYSSDQLQTELGYGAYVKIVEVA